MSIDICDFDDEVSSHLLTNLCRKPENLIDLLNIKNICVLTGTVIYVRTALQMATLPAAMQN